MVKILLKFFKTKKKLYLFSLVFTLSILLRLFRMEYLPFQSDFDEAAFIFAGQSILDLGYPVSISAFTENYNFIYKKMVIFDKDHNIKRPDTFVAPWFDHPPLLPLLIGSWVKLFGYNFPSIVPSLIYRIPMVAFSSITLLLVFLLSNYFFGFYPGLFSLFLIGFTPSIAIFQRLVVGENLYLPLLLISFYLLLKNQEKILIPILLTVLAGLAKVTGIITIPILTYFLLWKKKYKKAIIYATVSLILFFFIYFLYGYFLDWGQFLKILNAQSFARFVGWKTPTFIFSHPGFGTLSIPDIDKVVMLDSGYYLIMILGFLSLITKDKNDIRPLIFTTFSLLLLMWITSSEGIVLGWYKLPFFIFLSITAGRIIKKNVSFSLVLLMAVTALSNFGLTRNMKDPYYLTIGQTMVFRLIIGAVFSFIFLINLSKSQLLKKVNRIIFIILLVIYVGSSFYIVSKYYWTLCSNTTCHIPLITQRKLLFSKIRK